ncbi:hypothetical protein EHQ27_07435, partial [Leptospira wolffii]|uniref:ApeA N-terminal domain 1-containing protein n=1 Tax=Leptospira wolffii TaxID=409998 RepID=UPI001083D52C
MNIKQEFKIQGRWWIPERLEKKVYGELSYDPKGGIYLSLLERLDEPGKPKISILNGELFGSQKVTLTDVILEQGNLPFDQRAILSVSSILLNMHYTKKEDIKFIEISASIPDIFPWFKKSRIKINQQSPLPAIETIPSNNIKLDLGNLKLNFGIHFDSISYK